MHSAHSEFYDSHKKPSQDDLVNSKRKRFDEDIIPSDLDSEHADRMDEELEAATNAFLEKSFKLLRTILKVQVPVTTATAERSFSTCDVTT